MLVEVGLWFRGLKYESMTAAARPMSPMRGLARKTKTWTTSLNVAPAAVDPHSADQLVLPLALADGPSAFTVSRVTSHLLTNIDVIRRFVEREIVSKEEEGRPGSVQIT